MVKSATNKFLLIFTLLSASSVLISFAQGLGTSNIFLHDTFPVPAGSVLEGPPSLMNDAHYQQKHDITGGLRKGYSFATNDFNVDKQRHKTQSDVDDSFTEIPIQTFVLDNSNEQSRPKLDFGSSLRQPITSSKPANNAWGNQHVDRGSTVSQAYTSKPQFLGLSTAQRAPAQQQYQNRSGYVYSTHEDVNQNNRAPKQYVSNHNTFVDGNKNFAAIGDLMPSLFSLIFNGAGGVPSTNNKTPLVDVFRDISAKIPAENKTLQSERTIYLSTKRPLFISSDLPIFPDQTFGIGPHGEVVLKRGASTTTTTPTTSTTPAPLTTLSLSDFVAEVLAKYPSKTTTSANLIGTGTQLPFLHMASPDAVADYWRKASRGFYQPIQQQNGQRIKPAIVQSNEMYLTPLVSKEEPSYQLRPVNEVIVVQDDSPDTYMAASTDQQSRLQLIPINKPHSFAAKWEPEYLFSFPELRHAQPVLSYKNEEQEAAVAPPTAGNNQNRFVLVSCNGQHYSILDIELEEVACCGKQLYSFKEIACQAGRLVIRKSESGGMQSMKHSGFYQPSTHLRKCGKDKLTHYDPKEQFCCGSTLHPKIFGQICCENEIYAISPEGTAACCAAIPYNFTTHICQAGNYVVAKNAIIGA